MRGLSAGSCIGRISVAPGCMARLPTRGLYHRSPGEQGVDFGQGVVVRFVEARR